ncbi:hypothetical protein C1336_000040000 [Campylobacter jejuni subsp. jejuni 1336]|nr:hypothetical protein C1336_000040000 [Campylobacter jejuni subsp. jejuni 1336]
MPLSAMDLTKLVFMDGKNLMKDSIELKISMKPIVLVG